MSQDLLTTREAAELLGVGTTSIKRWADAGLLDHVKTPGGHRRFPRVAVESFAASEVGLEDELDGTATGAWLAALLEPRGVGHLFERLGDAHTRAGSWWSVAEELGDVLCELGSRWRRGELTVIQEHIASMRMSRGLAQHLALLREPDGPHALLVAAEGDDHTLGLQLVELCLREEGFSPIWVGRGAPIAFVADYIAREPIDLVGVSASEHSGDRRLLADQTRRLTEACRPRDIPLILGGRGNWSQHQVYAHRCRTLTEFRELLGALTSSERGSLR